MAQEAKMISQADVVESLAAEGLVSVSEGTGQPQKNMELSKFADALGKAVPQQQDAEQVTMTGLYAQTSDGKMVELTKESVASVMAGLMGTNKLFPFDIRYFVTDANSCIESGIYRSGSTSTNVPSTYGVLVVVKYSDYISQTFHQATASKSWVRSSSDGGSTWGNWASTDNFGYNTLAELSSGVAQQIGVKHIGSNKLLSDSAIEVDASYGLAVVSSRSSGHSGIFLLASSGVTMVASTGENFNQHFEVSKVSTDILSIKNISSVERRVECTIISFKGNL